jgi:hypothetical protein
VTAPLPSHRVQPSPELFRKAAQVVRKRGLAREKFIAPDGSGKVCMLGACAVAAGFDPDEGAWMVPVQEFLSSIVWDSDRPDTQPFLTVTAHNDRAQDAAEVAAFLEYAAIEAEGVNT